MFLRFVFGLWLLVPVLSLAGTNPSCFSSHLREAVEVNKDRKQFYSDLTQGRSDKVFRTLIRAEQLSYYLAKIYDMKAASFAKKGLPLFCEEFMPMNEKVFHEQSSIVVPAQKFQKFEYLSFRDKLLSAVSEKNIELISRISLEAIMLLEKNPAYHCMLRHVFESIYRFAYFLPAKIQQASQLNISSPLNISMSVIKLHILALNRSNQIDEMSAPIQEEGIPVLCSELPQLMNDIR